MRYPRAEDRHHDGSERLTAAPGLAGFLAAVVVAGVALAVLGFVGAMSSAEYLRGSNASGVAHVAPAIVSLLMAGAAVAAWYPMWVFRLVSALWAVGAAGFARPGLIQLGVDIPAWAFGLAVVPLAALAALAALTVAGSRIVRVSLWSAAVSPVFVGAVLLLPRVAGDWPALLALIAAAWVAPRAAARQRSFQ